MVPNSRIVFPLQVEICFILPYNQIIKGITKRNNQIIKLNNQIKNNNNCMDPSKVDMRQL